MRQWWLTSGVTRMVDVLVGDVIWRCGEVKSLRKVTL